LPVSNVGVYAATKAFNRVFTLGLASYLSNPKQESSQLVTPIDFLSVQPGYVDTNMAKNEKEVLTKKKKSAMLKLFVSPIDTAEGSFGCLEKLSMTPGARGHGLLYMFMDTVKGVLPDTWHTTFLGLMIPTTDIKKC